MAVGHVRPDRDDPPSMFRRCRDAFLPADIIFGQMEAPLSDRGTPVFVPTSPRRVASRNIPAVTEKGVGFNVMSHVVITREVRLGGFL